MTLIINEEDYIKHFGVPGMKWGQRKSKEQRVADRKDRSERISMARKVVRSREFEKRLEAADAEYFRNRKRLGKQEAQRIYKEKTGPLNQLRKDSNKIKDGREFAIGMGIIAGMFSASLIGGAIISRNW